MMKIDLRPHYAFAYSVESMAFGSKSLLYYSRKEKALHYKYMAPIIDFLNDGRKDMEFSVSISDDDAKVLEKLFALMVDVFNAYKGEPWHVLDGYECVVICGKRRIRFEGPCFESPFEIFNEIANNLLSIENWNQAQFEKMMRQVPEIIAKLEKYIAENR
jgi:hypothetical protein